jgi:hypothetical protein
MLKGMKAAATKLPRPVQVAVIAAVGLALGVGGTVAIGAATGRGDQASVARLDLPGSPAVAAGATPVDATGTGTPAAPSAPVRPGSPRAALQALLAAHAAGRYRQGWDLLDSASRADYPTAEVWAAAQADRLQPVTFQVGAERPGPDGTVEVAATVTHKPAVEPFSGLTPGRTEDVWRARREGGTWRIDANPVKQEPVLPADDRAPAAVQAWVAKLLACDQAGATGLEAGGERYGPTGFAGLPCERRGEWTVDRAIGFERSPDPVYVAAFGPDVQDWARLVPVKGPDSSFYAVVAPVGDAWRVLGTSVGPTAPATP